MEQKSLPKEENQPKHSPSESDQPKLLKVSFTFPNSEKVEVERIGQELLYLQYDAKAFQDKDSIELIVSLKPKELGYKLLLSILALFPKKLDGE